MLFLSYRALDVHLAMCGTVSCIELDQFGDGGHLGFPLIFQVGRSGDSAAKSDTAVSIELDQFGDSGHLVFPSG